MKSGITLAISMALNAGLAVALVVSLGRRKPPEAPQVITQNVTNTALRVVTKLSGIDATNLMRFRSNTWKTVESPDYRTYINNLRSIGCPEETIRDLIITDLNKLYAQKARALNPAASQQKFWKPDAPYDDPQNREFTRKLQQLEKEKRQTVQALLGVDYQAEMARQNPFPTYQERQLAFLGEGKRQQLGALLERYAELEQDIYSQANGELSAEQKAALEDLARQRRAEMAKVLSPAELAEYDLRTSSTSQELRYRMGAFNATEEEFRRLYQIQKNYEDQIRQAEESGTLSPQQREAARQIMEQEMKNLLGVERYGEYQLTQDSAYRELHQAAQRNELPKETVQAVYEMKKVAEEQRRRLLAAADDLTPEQKEAALAALRAETERAVKELMGEKAFKDYQRRGGNWMISLGADR